MSCHAELFTDADNTLWDTDAVYARAQLVLLAGVESAFGATVGPDDRLAFVRAVDQHIANLHPERLRYPAELLIRGLKLALDDYQPSDIAQILLAEETPPNTKNQALLAAYYKNLQDIPRLRPGVREGIEQLAKAGVPISVVTEDRAERCNRLLATHGLLRFVSTVRSLSKTPTAFALLRRSTKAYSLFMVGDQLDRDIEPAKLAGFQTFYFPGGFCPFWKGVNIPSDVTKVSRFDEIVPLVLCSATTQMLSR